MSTETKRQEAWAEVAEHSDGVVRTLFTMLAQPSAAERGHSHVEHSVGFSRDGRRGFKCGIDGTVIKWLDPDPEECNR